MDRVLRSPRREPKVVILAAGDGTRLRNGDLDLQKPLVQIHGRTLLERVILTAREAGLRRFVVVVGWQPDRIIEHARDLSRRHGVDIEVIRNEDWFLGNGTSVYASRQHVGETFYLVMCDHVFEPRVFREFVRQTRGTSRCALAVDPEVTNPLVDPEDATKVLHSDGKPLAIGKHLERYNGVDMGLFYYTREIFEALERAFDEGRYALTDAVRKLVEAGRLQLVIMPEAFWTDVDTPGDLVGARKGLVRTLWKPHEDGLVSRWLNRRISLRITPYLARLGISPTAITLVSVLMGLAGAVLFASGQRSAALLAAFLIQFASILDGCDGEVARLRLQSSPFGGWFDTLSDRYVDTAITLGITLAYARAHPGAGPWVLGTVAVLGFVMASYGRKEYRIRYGKEMEAGWAGLLVRRDVRILGIALGALAGRAFEAAVFLGLLSHAWLLWAVMAAGLEAGRIRPGRFRVRGEAPRIGMPTPVEASEWNTEWSLARRESLAMEGLPESRSGLERLANREEGWKPGGQGPEWRGLAPEEGDWARGGQGPGWPST
jgi:CDP-L-myo-inositol myo-inositolphosphotransferase